MLVLDEPAAGLDPVGKKEFLSLLHTLHGLFVKTIILVSHDMNLVSENCTRAAIFAHGKVVACGTPKEIFIDYDVLKDLGLDIPLTAYLTKKLAKNGVEIDSDLTVDGFISALKARYAGGE